MGTLPQASSHSSVGQPWPAEVSAFRECGRTQVRPNSLARLPGHHCPPPWVAQNSQITRRLSPQDLSFHLPLVKISTQSSFPPLLLGSPGAQLE